MMINPRAAAAALAIAPFFAAATDYVPAFLDAEGKVFGLFRLDIYKDALQVASGAWAAARGRTVASSGHHIPGPVRHAVFRRRRPWRLHRLRLSGPQHHHPGHQ
jgi:hypothetical protein